MPTSSGDTCFSRVALLIHLIHTRPPKCFYRPAGGRGQERRCTEQGDRLKGSSNLQHFNKPETISETPEITVLKLLTVKTTPPELRAFRKSVMEQV